MFGVLVLLLSLYGLDANVFTNEFVVELKRHDADFAKRLAQDNGFQYVDNVRSLEQQKILVRVKREIIHDKQLELDEKGFDDLSMYERYPQDKKRGFTARDFIPGEREKYKKMFSDPLWPDQWVLKNLGQTGGPKGNDLNVVPAWEKNITGKGVVVSILDDGVYHAHPDLKDNYDPLASADFDDPNDMNNDPTPNLKTPGNEHGTKCAGEVAMKANNKYCGVGVAYDAKIGGMRILDGRVTDSMEARALLYHNQHIDIYSASWGPKDNGKTMEGPPKHTAAALKKGVEEGRGGKGSIFVWATGNGGVFGDSCACDGYVSSIYSVSIGSVNHLGLSTYFMEHCPSTMAVVYCGGRHSMDDEDDSTLKVVTTQPYPNHWCVEGFQGTSAAAPLAAGCIALVLEANPHLTWRDVQHIVVHGARIPNTAKDDSDSWVMNGADHHVSQKFGFGAMDCGKMVELAQKWTMVGPQHICKVEADTKNKGILHSRGKLNFTLETDGCHHSRPHRIDALEHVEIHIKLAHPRRGDATIMLLSPAGTPSVILPNRPADGTSQAIDFTFMTVFNWGEHPKGQWRLMVEDRPQKDGVNTGFFTHWSMTMYGTSGSDPDAREEPGKFRPHPSGDKPAKKPSYGQLREMFKEEKEETKEVHINNEDQQKADRNDLVRKIADRYFISENQARRVLEEYLARRAVEQEEERKEAARRAEEAKRNEVVKRNWYERAVDDDDDVDVEEEWF